MTNRKTPTSTSVARLHRRARRWSVGDLAGWRTVAYRMFSSLLLPPDEPRLWWLRATAAELRHDDDELAVFGFFGPWQELLIALEGTTDQQLPVLQTEYVRLFCANLSGAPCLPYESGYVAAVGQEAGLVASQLDRTYARAGLEMAASANDGPDHATVELEFMSYLCRKELEAWERAEPVEALQALRQERAFLHLHLSRWFGLFAERVQAKTAERLYLAAVSSATAFIHHDLDLIETLLSDIKRLGHEGNRPGDRLEPAQEGST